MSTTIKEIAKAANVSTATVSRAFSNDTRVKPETKELVLKVASELNYNPNMIARFFVKRTTNLVGLILPDIGDEFFSDLIKGVDDTFYDRGFFTLVTSSHKNRSILESLSGLMSGGLTAGIILLIPSLSRELENKLNSSKIPIVVISGTSDLGQYDAISFDNYNASYKMTEFLIKKGYSKIAHITGPLGNLDALNRFNGFLDCMKDNGIQINNDWILEGDYQKKTGAKLCEILLSLHNTPNVIFAANDMMAIGCYQKIKERGLNIPNDIAIAGFDDILLAKLVNPPLTTVSTNVEELGNIAANILIDRIVGKNGLPVQLKLPAKLIIRESC